MEARRSKLEDVALVVMIAVSLLIGWAVIDARLGQKTSRSKLQVPSEPVPISGAPAVGDARARVALIEFSDFQCPFCGKFVREAWPDIERDFVRTGKIRLIFRNFPLVIHSLAQPAAESALCAMRQGQFWPMHDRLFADQSRLDPATIRGYAQALGMELNQFDACVSGHETRDHVRTDAELAKTLGVGGTPTFLVGVLLPNGSIKGAEWIGGALSYEEFKKVIDRHLRKTSVP